MASSRLTISLCCLILSLNSLVVGQEEDISEEEDVDPDKDVDVTTAEGETLRRHLLAKPDGEIRSFFVNPQNSDVFYLEYNGASKKDKINVIKSGSTISHTYDNYEGIPQSFTPDFDNKLIYLGAYSGIYKLPMDTFKAETAIEGEKEIANVVFANKDLYVLQYEGSPYKYVWDDGKPKREDISPAITLSNPHFSVDTEGTIYYVNDKDKLIKLTKDGNLSAISIEGANFLYATALDAKDRLLIANSKKIYTLNKGEDEVALLLSTPEVATAIATDNDSIYTVEFNKIFKYSKP